MVSSWRYRQYRLKSRPLFPVVVGLLQVLIAKRHRVLLIVDSLNSARNMDLHLWTYKAEAFLPHSAVNSAENDHDTARAAPIWIDTQVVSPSVNNADTLFLVDGDVWKHQDEGVSPEFTDVLRVATLDSDSTLLHLDRELTWAHAMGADPVRTWQEDDVGKLVEI